MRDARENLAWLHPRYWVVVLVLLIPSPSLAAVCEGVRPGAPITIGDKGCTMNFMFRDRSGHRYVGTAGHCVSSVEGVKVWPGATGEVARDGAGAEIGTVAYAAYRPSFPGKLDFALVRIDPEITGIPSMCGWGGPRGINEGKPEGITELRWYGQGDVLGEASPQRNGYAFGMPEDEFVFFNGPAITGDSGSAVIDAEGRAVGVFVTVGIHSWSSDPPHVASNGHIGYAGLMRLTPQLQKAEIKLRTRLSLIEDRG